MKGVRHKLPSGLKLLETADGRVMGAVGSLFAVPAFQVRIADVEAVSSVQDGWKTRVRLHGRGSVLAEFDGNLKHVAALDDWFRGRNA